MENELYTAQKICDMGADGARIYPTVTFFDTELACMARRGEYEMLSIDDAIYRSKEVYKLFSERDVECIRIGLCASDNLGDLEKVKGGANHPALGELVKGELCYDVMREIFVGIAKKGGTAGKSFIVSVGVGELSLAIGQKGKNKKRLVERYKPYKIEIKEKEIPQLVSTFEKR